MVFFILFLLIMVINSLTTIPLSVAFLVVATVIFRRSWVFLVAFGLGLFLDLYELRMPGQTSLFLVFLIFIIRLYERKFETQTLTFVFFATLVGSTFYLWLFEYQTVFLQAFINALMSVLFFRVMLNSFQHLHSMRS